MQALDSANYVGDSAVNRHVGLQFVDLKVLISGDVYPVHLQKQGRWFGTVEFMHMCSWWKCLDSSHSRAQGIVIIEDVS